MNKINILIVEDEIIVATNIKNILEELGYNVLDIISSGESAINKVNEIQPDLILMDIMLDGNIDGITAFKEIQSKFNIPVIYITAFSDDSIVERAKTTIPYGYINKPFTKEELHTAIEIALYNYKKDKELLMERKLAQKMYQKLLPSKMPCIKKLYVYSKLNSSKDFSGDFYDVIKISDTQLGIFIADVVDKGLAAAFMVSNIKAIISAEEKSMSTPAEFMKRINQMIVPIINEDQFVSALFALIDTEHMILRYVNAGLPNPIILRDNTSTQFLLGNLTSKQYKGLPLGIFPNMDYNEIEISLKDDDKILFFTNGITLIKNSNKEFFNAELLCESLLLGCSKLDELTMKGSTLEDQVNNIVESIIQDANILTNSEDLKDDVLLLCVHFNPRSTQKFYHSFIIDSDIKALRNLICKVCDIFFELGIEKNIFESIKIAFNEAIYNAIVHGNKFDKNKKIYIRLSLVEEYENGNKLMGVQSPTICNEAGKQKINEKLILTISDEGNGFNYHDIPNPIAPENITKDNGRGIFIIKYLMDNVYFNNAGNEITMIKNICCKRA